MTSIESSSDRASRHSPTTRFTQNAEPPGGHKHHLGNRPPPENPSPWRRALVKKCKRVQNGLSLSILKINHAAQPGPSVSIKTLGDTEGTSAGLEEKYGKRWKTIGRGAYGTVSIFRKVDITGQDEALFAVKEFHRRPRQDVTAHRDRILGEISLVGNIRHTNIVRILDLFEIGQNTFLEVMEYCSSGDVFTLVQAAGPLVAAEADCFLKQLMRGVKYLHDMDVAHCDLKPENLLLTPQGILKITDFGFCHDLVPSDGDGVQLLSGMRGSLPYIAPEEHTDKEFDARGADVWACGVIYMFMRSARYLWRSAQADDEDYLTYVKDRRVEKGYALIEQLDHAQSQNVVYSMLDPVPSRRLSASQFLRSEWGYAIQVCKDSDDE